MADERDPLCVEMEDNSKPEWSLMLNTIKKEAPDCEDFSLNVGEQIPAAEIVPTASHEENTVSFEEISVKVENDEENFRSCDQQDGQDTTNSSENIHFVSCEIIKDEIKEEDNSADVEEQDTQNETASETLSREQSSVSFPRMIVRMKYNLMDNRNLVSTENQNTFDGTTMDSWENTTNEAILYQVTDGGPLFKTEDTKWQISLEETGNIASSEKNTVVFPANVTNNVKMTMVDDSTQEYSSADKQNVVIIPRSSIKVRNKVLLQQIAEEIPKNEKLSSEKPLAPSKLAMKYGRSSDLMWHSKLQLKNPYACSQCPLSFETCSLFVEHFKSHFEKYSCRKCSAEFNSESKLHLHVLQTHFEKELQTHFEKALQRHSETELLCCEQCPKQFKSELSLYCHTLAIHTKKVTPPQPSDRLPAQSTSNQNNRLIRGSKRHQPFLQQIARKIPVHDKIMPDRPFVCSQCSARFIRSCDLGRHQKMHSKQQFTCLKCLINFEDRSLFLEHLKSHSEKLFSCNQCPAQYKNEALYTLHLRTHFNEKRFPCKQCSEKFESKDSLHQHTFFTHVNITSPQPQDIASVQATVDQIYTNIRKNQKKYSCPECSESFNRSSAFQMHLKSHFRKPYSCAKCLRVFKTKTALEDHLQGLCIKKKLACNKCTELFDSEISLYRHILSIHMEKMTFPQPLNTTQISTASCSENEEVKQSENPELSKQWLHCPRCSKSFRLSCSLERHLKTIHNEATFPQLRGSTQIPAALCSENGEILQSENLQLPEGLFSCPRCSQSFRRSWALERHLRIIHDEVADSSENILSCEECSVRFGTKTELRRHFRRYLNRQFSCKECKIQFKCKCNLNEHVLQVHVKERVPAQPMDRVSDWDTSHPAGSPSAEKHYACELCAMQFKLQCSLKRHIAVTHAEKPKSARIRNTKPDTCANNKRRLSHDQRAHIPPPKKRTVVLPESVTVELENLGNEERGRQGIIDCMDDSEVVSRQATDNEKFSNNESTG